LAPPETASPTDSQKRSLFRCSWCEVVFRNGQRAVGQAENYGICPPCLSMAVADLAWDAMARTA